MTTWAQLSRESNFVLAAAAGLGNGCSEDYFNCEGGGCGNIPDTPEPRAAAPAPFHPSPASTLAPVSPPSLAFDAAAARRSPAAVGTVRVPATPSILERQALARHHLLASRTGNCTCTRTTRAGFLFVAMSQDSMRAVYTTLTRVIPRGTQGHSVGAPR